MRKKLTLSWAVKVFTLCLLSVTAFSRPGYETPWGKDAHLITPTRSDIPPVPENRSRLVKMAEKVILFHQNIISPADGPRSSFRPTSARYMLLAMRRHGFLKGYVMGCDRLLRENKDDWVYRTRTIDGITYKFDPTY